MTTITIDRATVEQALHVAENAGYPLALIKALRTALAQQAESVPTHRINSWGFCGVCRHDRIPGEGCARQECPDSPQQAESLTIERLRDALVASRIIQPAAVEDPDEYDDGVTLYRIEALHRRIT